ncbi:DUF3576 domain-containing protein [Acetobacter suratthaniensis]|uniref:DUF3576 domain-containing protein n=1 Tax=Acetobacter suratthaniensis TaxID=1502841 RepID=A0ABS3LM79_9PROT|nr:DUF3576 domain-containing protein [Acetobacter suratthaniensis]MBO1328478.1 DUF3576 domain-containing protein [Acetobacter suratthaniensis]MCX2566607.1 DUF3576 domain-containing protein [Acetobacter suratthaniensis]
MLRRLMPRSPSPRPVMALAALCLLASCSSDPKTSQGLTAPDGRLLHEDRGASGGETGLKGGVNAYLWRATLDTISFMPVATADAEGGIILTDWYTPPAAHDERFKITAFILDRRLRSDALRLSVFRQVREGGAWVDTPPAPNTASDIAARILSRARKLRANNGNRD